MSDSSEFADALQETVELGLSKLLQGTDRDLLDVVSEVKKSGPCRPRFLPCCPSHPRFARVTQGAPVG